jgi:hypothetical protein
LNSLNENAVIQKFVWQPEAVGLDVPLSVYDTAASATYYYFTDANKNVGQIKEIFWEPKSENTRLNLD